MTALARIAVAHNLARLTRHGELIAQPRTPTLRMGKAIVPLPPAAFLQATAAGEATLARLVCAHVPMRARVADLFAGVGPFALRLAERARVLAVDDDEAALAALKRAAASTAGLKPIAPSAAICSRARCRSGTERLRRRGVRSAASGCRSTGA